jgi:hypothetical protein
VLTVVTDGYNLPVHVSGAYTVANMYIVETSGSHSSEYEDYSFLGIVLCSLIEVLLD